MTARGNANTVKPKSLSFPPIRLLPRESVRGFLVRKPKFDSRAGIVLPGAASRMLPALAAQILAVPVAGGIASVLWFAAPHWEAGVTELALFQGGSAAVIARWSGAAGWQVALHFAFVPAAVLLLASGLDPDWYLAAFVALLLVFGGCYRTKVPLYFSSTAAVEALVTLLPQRRGFSFIDLGCGCGGVLRRLAKARPDGIYHGMEWAPLPFLFGKLRHTLASMGCRIIWGDFRNHDLAGYDVVYAYLSPAPMQELWHKARKEMLPGSILVSNTFAVPGVAPQAVVRVDDVSGTELLVWRM